MSSSLTCWSQGSNTQKNVHKHVYLFPPLFQLFVVSRLDLWPFHRITADNKLTKQQQAVIGLQNNAC